MSMLNPSELHVSPFQRWIPDFAQTTTFGYGVILLFSVLHAFFFEAGAVNRTHIVVDTALWLMFPCCAVHYFFPVVSSFFMAATMVFMVLYFWKVERRRVFAMLSVCALVCVIRDWVRHVHEGGGSS
eukprot:PhF_6_TR25760/c0_g1_i2/m.36323